MYVQCDLDGNQRIILKCVVDYKKDASDVPEAESFTIHRSRKFPKKITKGWNLCVNWRDDSSS